MSDDFSTLVLDKQFAGYAFSFLQGYLSNAGLTIENPGDGKVYIASNKEGEEGERIESSLSEIFNTIQSHRIVSFQWWFHSASDLFCWFRFVDGLAYVTLYLDGLEDEEINLVENCCISLIRMLIDLDAGVGLVFDRVGKTADFDWYSFFSDTPDALQIECFPDILVINSKHIELEQIVMHHLTFNDYQGFYFIKKD